MPQSESVMPAAPAVVPADDISATDVHIDDLGPGSLAAAPSSAMEAEIARQLQEDEDQSNLPEETKALMQMAAMGFLNQEKNMELLKKYKGDVERAVADLLL